MLGTLSRLPPPTLITDVAWDALLLLDACRLDAFRALRPESGGIVSPGTTTLGWAKANLVSNPAARQLSDAVLVTANPWTSKEHFATVKWHHPFAHCVSVFKQSWDETFDTVLPDVVVDAALEALDLGHPRIVVHFLQPHTPYVAGEPLVTLKPGERAHNVTWQLIMKGHISRPKAMKAYMDNLRLVLNNALRLADNIDGRVVITSDHGELFGEYGLYAHPDVRVPELAWVPWIEVKT
jgi:hypothetical protein